jgi:tRNA (guanine10-N2)-dimethyltransferase
MQSLLVLGRQPALGLAELESMYGSERLTPISSNSVLVDIDPCLLNFDRLGGSVKFCKVLTQLKTTRWEQIEQFLRTVSPEHAAQMPPGKMQLGLSVYGLDITPARIQATGLGLKKVLRKSGRSVRLIPNNERFLNSAQVLHNHLTGQTGWELVFVRHDDSTIIAQTIKAQDIAAYTKRDRYRPKRDAKIGMLPPKLAQIIINLACGALTDNQLDAQCTPGKEMPPLPFEQVLLDPFCGTGVILIEAALMGYKTYGTDLEPRMIEFTTANLEWFMQQYRIDITPHNRLEVADATSHAWQKPIHFVACEAYLGRPFVEMPSREVLSQTVSDCNLIIKKFLRNIHSQLPSGTRLCIAVPAWQIAPVQFTHLPLIDQIEELGYNRLGFEQTKNEDLLYCRPKQFVARELLVLKVK